MSYLIVKFLPSLFVCSFIYSFAKKKIFFALFNFRSYRIFNLGCMLLARYSICARGLHFSAKNGARGPLTFPGWYPRDHMPDAYPETEEEHRAAAIKYGLRPEDYKPISKDDVVHHAGNYPDLGLITYDNMDPYENYTDSHNRRNWGQPTQMSVLKHRADRNSYNGLDIEDFTLWNFIKYSSILLIPMGLLIWENHRGEPEKFRMKNPKMIKQYAYDYYRTFPYGNARKYPILNYTFEPAE
jgi:hypothetical protein